jgi:hypothetical protein
MRYPFFDPLISRYIRERLNSECQVRGAETEIARAAGISQSHVSAIANGQRTLGEDFAAAMCRYWGIKQSDLRRIAHQTYDSRALVDAEPKTHPNLDATLDFYRSIYPKPFVEEFELDSRRGPDRPKLEWVFELQNRFRVWLGAQIPSVQRKHMHLLGLPVASMGGVPATTKKGSDR